ncbi:hypothetical protein BS47DRAFT_616971 [Hydnum rufescens UP504]|uniref:Uncharacterized protein n=1 Tax=Hydnum rufescens UP504 TaxID=1448309 RepID=A0A9P6AFP2_9AGAM|nr:hypothetical protein BS47DRAFT_616971 [Hydnum rufescens UP504]
MVFWGNLRHSVPWPSFGVSTQASMEVNPNYTAAPSDFASGGPRNPAKARRSHCWSERIREWPDMTSETSATPRGLCK